MASEEDRPDKVDITAKNMKVGLDRQILKEYTNVMKLAWKGGRTIDDTRIWDDLADKLELSYDARRRYLKGVNKHGQKPVSPIDGRPEPYEPGFEEVFRYIAAADLDIAFPRGRVIVNRAIATLLSQMRASRYGEPRTLTDCEVERLRFLRALDDEASFKTIDAMLKAEGSRKTLMEPIEYSPRFVVHLQRLDEGWTEVFEEFVSLVDYKWID